jgi:hypothetical protein
MIEDFEKIDETVTDFVASELLKRNIPLDKNKDGSVFVGPSLYNGIDGFYFKHPSLTVAYNKKTVSNLFPMGLGPYTVYLKTITEPKQEDDRLFAASIGFVAIYND